VQAHGEVVSKASVSHSLINEGLPTTTSVREITSRNVRSTCLQCTWSS